MSKILKGIFNYFIKTDWVIWLSCLALSALSVVLIYGILQTEYAEYLRISNQTLLSQGVAVGIGVILAVVLSLIDYRSLARLWMIYVPIAYLFVISTFFIGVAAPGRPEAKRWIVIPGINLNTQPSEFLRVFFILSLAYHIKAVHKKINSPRNILCLCLHGIAPVILIHFQGDSGAALIFGLIFMSMIFVAGIRLKYLLFLLASMLGAIPVMWNFVLGEFQKQRILAVFFPSGSESAGYYYQQSQAKIEMGSGQLWGLGIFSNTHTYVPEIQNDFIYSFIGESLGFIGCITVILLIAVMCMKILINAFGETDKLGQMIYIGVFAMICFSSCFNIGMCLSLLPVMGNALPFLSSGGSAMFSNYLGIGLILSVYSHSHKSKLHNRFD